MLICSQLRKSAHSSRNSWVYSYFFRFLTIAVKHRLAWNGYQQALTRKFTGFVLVGLTEDQIRHTFEGERAKWWPTSRTLQNWNALKVTEVGVLVIFHQRSLDSRRNWWLECKRQNNSPWWMMTVRCRNLDNPLQKVIGTRKNESSGRFPSAQLAPYLNGFRSPTSPSSTIIKCTRVAGSNDWYLGGKAIALADAMHENGGCTDRLTSVNKTEDSVWDAKMQEK